VTVWLKETAELRRSGLQGVAAVLRSSQSIILKHAASHK